MDDRILKLMMDKPIFIPRILLCNYRKLNITEEELVIIMMIIAEGNKVIYNPINIANEINMDKIKVMELINNLIEKHLINSGTEKNNNKKEEYLYLDLLYNKLVNIVIDKKEENKEIKYTVFETFETELGRTLSPMEYDKIKDWINDGITEELITEALRETVLNGISRNSFNYIDKILTTWKSKGIKNKEDVLKERNNFKKKESKKIEVYHTNWLDSND